MIRQLPVVIGADHAGFAYKEILKQQLADWGWTVDDKGTYNTDSVDYPELAHPVASAVASGTAAFGVLICGSGEGVLLPPTSTAMSVLRWYEQ
ncbi:MAG: RpiB/LacA/LacB family sugar-phosphate isomerase [Chitinophagaceae bacterium]